MHIARLDANFPIASRPDAGQSGEFDDVSISFTIMRTYDCRSPIEMGLGLDSANCDFDLLQDVILFDCDWRLGSGVELNEVGCAGGKITKNFTFFSIQMRRIDEVAENDRRSVGESVEFGMTWI